MSNDPNLIALIQEVNDAARELRDGIEKRQKEMDRTLIVMGALGATAIMVKMWFEVLS